MKHRAYLNISIEPLLVFSWFKYQGRTVFKIFFSLCRFFGFFFFFRWEEGVEGNKQFTKTVLVAFRLVALYRMEKIPQNT